MKVLLVSNYRIEEGRGPLFRLIKMLPYLIKYCEVETYSFGPYDEKVLTEIKKMGLKTYEYEYKNNGWFVLNNNEIAQDIKMVAEKNNIDLVVLTWEIWDIAVALYNKLKLTKINFLVVMHSIPFATSLIKTTNYTLDCIYKFIIEKNFMIKKYMFLKNYQAYIYMKKFNILTMTKTVEKKLNKYFTDLSLCLSYPGYSIDLPSISKTKKYKYDYVFMAKFEYGKGIFEFIKIVRELKIINNNLKFVMIGSFTFQKEEEKFNKLVKKYNLYENIVHCGWLDDREKYKVIQESKIFLYPSFIGDTFSQSLLEALSCGKKIICYDVPFTRDNFILSTVIRIKVFDNKKFAKIAYEELMKNKYFFEESINFVKHNYHSWNQVARAEYKCYEGIIKNNTNIITQSAKINNCIYKNKNCLIKEFNNIKEYKKIIKYYKYFNNEYINKIYKFNKNSLIMKKENGDIILNVYPNFDKRLKVIFNLFYDWFKTIKCYNYKRNLHKISFEQKIKKQIKCLEKYKMYDELLVLYNLYKDYFYNCKFKGKKYLLHGDINLRNIICDDGKYVLIDLSPLYGIKELELVKYIEDEIFLQNNINILNKFIFNFKILNINNIELKKVLFLDSCYRTFDSFIENESIEIINKGIKINKKLYELLMEEGDEF